MRFGRQRLDLVTMSGRALISLTFHVAFEPSVALSRQHRALRVSLFETSQDGVGACCMPLAGADHSIGRPLLRAWLEQCLRAERQARQCHLSLSILFSLNPFANIWSAVLKPHTIRFTTDEKAEHLAINQANVLQI